MSQPILRELIRFRPVPAQAQEQRTRRRTLWGRTTSLMAGNGHTVTGPPVAPRPRTGTHPSVREIHKNAWLKRQLSTEKKGTPFSKKGEKFWVVFCVHDDVEAFLEFYTEPKMGTIHKPLSAISINSCLHVSPSIMGQDNEYQFAVTLPTEVIRLVAANWDQMIEWVESLQGKLREMNILSPKDNLYSKLPEAKLSTVGSTRDPNSPLPPTPSSLAASNQRIVVNQNFRTEPAINSRTETSNLRDSNPSREESHASNLSSRLSVNGNTSAFHLIEREPTRSAQLSDSHIDNGILTPNVSQQSSSEGSQDTGTQTTKKTHVCVKLSVDINNVHRNSSGSITQSHQRHHFTGPVTSASATVVVIGNGDMRIQNGHNDSSHRPDGRNGSVFMAVNGSSSGSSSTSVSIPESNLESNSSLLATDDNNTEQRNGDERAQNGESGSHSSAPSVSRVAVDQTENPNVKVIGARQRSTVSQDAENLPIVHSTAPSSKTVKSTSSENIYEHIYIPERFTIGERNGVKHIISNGNQSKMRSQTTAEIDARNRVHRSSSQRSPEGELPSSSARDSHARRVINAGGSSQRSSSLSRIELPVASSNVREHPRDHNPPRQNGNRNRPSANSGWTVGNSTFFENNSMPQQLQGNPIDALIGSRTGEYKLRRDEYLIRMGSSNDNQSNDLSSPNGDPNSDSTKFQSNVPLKEQQVINLQTEINHPGGVRVILRKKDCLTSLAFVDYLGAVWMAGWKQTQFPVLYYAFHIGDQILKVAGVTVQSSVEASRAIKMVSSMQVEFIIRRLPYGKVFALKRSRDGEPLGLVAEGGSGEISEVLPEGLAARYGLPPKGLSVDGQTPCNWYLTEVNNRPLSLMSKENEVKDRLNAVGKEISILVQPADLVKHLRKSLKSYKGFKDYVVG